MAFDQSAKIITNTFLALLLTAGIAACGGGGSDNTPPQETVDENTETPRETNQPEQPDPEQPQSDTPAPETPTDVPGVKQTLLQFRIKSATIDLDYNGTPDGAMQYGYDAAGRLTHIEYVYTADGVEDNLLDYVPMATLFPDSALSKRNEIRIYNQQGWPVGAEIIRFYAGSEAGKSYTSSTFSESRYGAEGIDTVITMYANENGALESTKTTHYQNFVNGLPQQIQYEYTPPPFEGSVFDKATLTRNSRGRVETLHQVDQYGDLGDIEERFTLEWNEDQLASYKANFKEYPLSLNRDTTIRFEYENRCLTKERYEARGVSLGAEIREDTTVYYIHDSATQTPLFLEVDNNSDGTIDARMDFEIEPGPYLIFTYPTLKELEQSSELEHALFCMTAPSPL